jgi:hypothetical protein
MLRDMANVKMLRTQITSCFRITKQLIEQIDAIVDPTDLRPGQYKANLPILGWNSRPTRFSTLLASMLTINSLTKKLLNQIG